MRLQQLGGRLRFGIELRKPAVALRIVVVGIDDDLAGERRHRNLAVVLQRNGDDDDVPCAGCFVGGRGPGMRAELADEFRQRVGAAGIAHDDVVTGLDGEPRDLAADVPGADETDGAHGSIIPRFRIVWPRAYNSHSAGRPAQPAARKRPANPPGFGLARGLRSHRP